MLRRRPLSALLTVVLLHIVVGEPEEIVLKTALNDLPFNSFQVKLIVLVIKHLPPAWNVS